MIHRVLGIGRWGIDFLFATKRYDIDGVLACLYDAYAPDDVMQEAKDKKIVRCFVVFQVAQIQKWSC